MKIPYNVVEHKAGVRPSVSDRRPVLGPCKDYEQLVVFNGLGTKGVSLAPFFQNSWPIGYVMGRSWIKKLV